MTYRVYSGPKGSGEISPFAKEQMLFKEFSALDDALFEELEGALLSIDVAVIFLLSGTAASLLFSLVNPTTPLIGASGGIIVGAASDSARQESARVSVTIFGARKPEAPIGRKQCERFPAVVTPGVASLGSLLKDQVLSPALL